jgi:hypothetical protein
MGDVSMLLASRGKAELINPQIWNSNPTLIRAG